MILNQKAFTSWREIESAISKLKTTKEKGDAFEFFAHAFFSIFSKTYNLKNVYMFKDIPKKITNQYRLENKDNGVDGIIITNDEKVIAYQVKFRSDNTYANYSELSTFWAESEYCDGRCIFSNSFELPKQAGKKKNQFTILLNTLLELEEDFFFQLYNFFTKSTSIEFTKFKPLPHQDTIIKNTISGFLSADRGKIIAACGTGKTLTSLWIHEAIKSKATLFIVPSLALIKQTMNQWVRHSNIDFHFICVCSDMTMVDDVDDEIIIEKTSSLSFPVTTDPKDIKNFLLSDGNKVVFSTYHSLDCIVNGINEISDFSFDFAIFDEAHRTAGTKDSDMFVFAMDDEYIPIKKRLFMTATERVVSPRIKTMLKEIGRAHV